jgi:hypothetical protein
MSGKLLLFITRITLICVLFQGCGGAFASAINEANQRPQAPLPPQTVVNPPSDLNSTYPGVPNQPTAPKSFKKPDVKDAFHCERQFLYKGRTYGCDSFVQRDAERLRLIVADVPESTQEIDVYQRNRKNVKRAAYVGSMGLLIFLGGLFVSRSFTDSNGNIDQTGNAIRLYSAIGGLGLTIASVGVGFGLLYKNESHIDNAVKFHNEAHPNTPITLQFSKELNL